MWEGDYTARVNEKGKAFQFGNFVGKKYETSCINDKVYKALIELCTDICKRNNIKELKWKGDKSLIGKVNQQNMTVHRWFANKSCPGDYMYNRLGQIAEEVNNNLKPKKKTIDEIAKEVIQGLWGNGKERKDRLTKAGYNYSKVQKRVNDLI